MLWGRQLVLAQEVEDEKDSLHKPESEKTPEEKVHDRTIEDYVAGKAPFAPADVGVRYLNRPIVWEKGSPPRPSSWGGLFPPTTFVQLGEKGWLGERRISFEYSYWNQSGTVKKGLSDPYIGMCVQSGDLFVLSGNVSPDDEKWFKRFGQTVVVSNASPKQEKRELAHAAALTLRPFKSEEAVVLNALPYETGGSNTQKELTRMGLKDDPKGWRSAQEGIASAAGKIPIRRATKKEVLREFRDGNGNVLLVMAHSASNVIYLPGVEGGKITLQDLDSLRRESAPDRVIVLLACKTGEVNGQTPSIAETLIKNKLASTVLASDDIIYTGDVAEMLRSLQENTALGRAFENLRTIVEVRPDIRWRRDQVSHPI
jgi:hypothetical protein